VILRLRDVVRLPANNSAASHPDQQYWRIITQNGASRVQSVWNIVNPMRANIIREHMGGGGSSKRVVLCRSGATSADLLTAYNNHDGCGWAP
jgi:hypothetical protein